MKLLLSIALLFLTACNYFDIGGHTFSEYERLCGEFGGLDRAYFMLGDSDVVVLRELKCNNGVVLTHEYVKERFISEKERGER